MGVAQGRHQSEASTVGPLRLDSRFATYRVTPRESLMLHSSLAELFDMCLSFGGDENRVPVPHGVRPSEEPRGAGASPNREPAKTPAN